MKIKRDNKAEIEAWAKQNQIKKLKTEKASGATLNGTVCAGDLVGWQRKHNKPKQKRKNSKKKRLIEFQKKKRIQQVKRARKKRILNFKARLLHNKLDGEMILALQRDET